MEETSHFPISGVTMAGVSLDKATMSFLGNSRDDGDLLNLLRPTFGISERSKATNRDSLQRDERFLRPGILLVFSAFLSTNK